MAFEFAYDLTGGVEIVRKYPVKNTVVLSKGELTNLESGELDTAATADTTLMGATKAAVDNTSDGEYVYVTVNPFAVYRVPDTTVRAVGATLDIASGGLGIATSSNADLIVVDSDGTHSYVTFNRTHFLT